MGMASAAVEPITVASGKMWPTLHDAVLEGRDLQLTRSHQESRQSRRTGQTQECVRFLEANKMAPCRLEISRSWQTRKFTRRRAWMQPKHSSWGAKAAKEIQDQHLQGWFSSRKLLASGPPRFPEGTSLGCLDSTCQGCQGP